MTRRIAVAAVLLAISAGGAGATKQGGVLRVASMGSSVQIDPQVAYVSTAWWLEYATAAKLFNYPDRAGKAGGLLRSEVASGYTVSRDGKTYTFTIRNGFRFSDGSAVTAKNFQYAFTRVRNTRLGSPGIQYIDTVRRTQAKGNRFVIRLREPDVLLLAKLAMPFFQATSTKLPAGTEVTTGYPSAGPYYFARNELNVLTSIRKNPFWKRGPGRRRPRNLDGVDVCWNAEKENACPAVIVGQTDLRQPTTEEIPQLVERFGVNKTRFWSMPIQCIRGIYVNTSSGPFMDRRLRQAVSWGIDRTDYMAAYGAYAGRTWTHFLSPTTPGSVTAQKQQPYAPRANVETARRLAAGHMGDGIAVIRYRTGNAYSLAVARLVRRDLIRIGFDPDKVELKGLFPGPGGPIQPPERSDLQVGTGWCDSFDAYADLRDIVALAPAYRARLDRAATLKGNARLRALGKLDVDMMRNEAPVVAMGTFNNRYLFSSRVDPRSLVFSSLYQGWSIPALALK